MGHEYQASIPAIMNEITETDTRVISLTFLEYPSIYSMASRAMSRFFGGGFGCRPEMLMMVRHDGAGRGL
jgi:hypothetical protein